MFRSLFTPISARFQVPAIPTGRSASISSEGPAMEEAERSPEELQRDMRVQLMRNWVEDVKTAPDVLSKVQVLGEIQRMMAEDAFTKDVFREADGFVVLVNLLSTLRPDETDTSAVETSEGTRLAFAILADAMRSHPVNKDWFEHRVGYELLEQAIRPLVADARTVDQTFGFLFALALQDFSQAGLFVSLREAGGLPEAEALLVRSASRLGPIQSPKALLVSIHLLDEVPKDTLLVYSTFKVLERLSMITHRNQSALNALGLVGILFARQYSNDPANDDTPAQLQLVLAKLLRRMLDMGASMRDARVIFQHAARRLLEAPDSLNMPVVDLLRSGMRAKWPEHFSLEGSAAIVLKETSPKGMPCPSGFSFIAWMSMEKFPVGDELSTVFGLRIPGPGGRWLIRLSLRSDGTFEFTTAANREPTIFRKPAAQLHRARWTHVVLTHHPHRRGASIPTVRLFVDGALVDAVNWAYPRLDSSGSEYVLGDDKGEGGARWCLASAYLLAQPLGDDMPRLFHHLGPRYTANFQAPSLIRFLTYEASASLNIHLASLRLEQNGGSQPSALTKAVTNGVGFKEDSIVFALNPAGWRDDAGPNKTVENGVAKPAGPHSAEVRGDVMCAKPQCLDVSLWQVGGPAVTLRLVELADTPQDLCTTLSILCDGLRTSWQNSEDMERMSGYEILAAILRQKAQMVNMSSYRILMEFVGVDFGHPTHSTIVNSIAYEFVVLDMHIWSKTRKEVQTAHLNHFGVLLRDSDFARFNARQRLAKFSLVRKLLYVLQTDWYATDVVPHLVDALRVVAEQNFSTDGAIKPIVSYLAANLPAEHAGNMTPSPRSALPRIDRIHAHEKAEQVLEALVTIVSDPIRMKKFTTALPITRILLLLLGEKPSSIAASQILLMLALVVRSAPSFPRKFELVSGWTTLKTVLPPCWDPSVHVAAFDVLLGRTNDDVASIMSPASGGAPAPAVVCPQILPTILLSFGHGLDMLAGAYLNGTDDNVSVKGSYSTMDVLIEEFIDLHASSESFRLLFVSQPTTTLFVTAVKGFVDKIATAPTLQDRMLRLTEKLTHLILMLALDNNVDSSQKHELLEVLRKSEEAAAAASDGTREPANHASLVEAVEVDDKDKAAHRKSRASMSLNLRMVSDRVVQKSTSRLGQWRQTIMATEKKRLRKATQDVREYHRQAERLGEWRLPLLANRGLWARPSVGPSLWRLDETEGPFRVRKKLEPEHDKAKVGTKILRDGVRDVGNGDGEPASPVAIEVPPWAESYEFSSTDVEEDQQWNDDMAEDKMRRVRHQLEPGDVIQAVKTVTRIVGVDSSPGLLILGKTHVYMLDGLVENDEGEVIDACDAPKNVFAVPGTVLELDGIQRAQRWSYDQVASTSKRSCLFRDVALEIYMCDSRTLLVVFATAKDRQDINAKLTMLHGGGLKTPEPHSAGGFRTPLIRSVGSKVLTGFREEIWTAQRRWQAREISNFTYLSIINQSSGRTPADVTQYPVFPWVIADYESEELDFTNPATFRDFNFPMGAQTEARRESAQQRYTNLEGIDETPFHYGTHFSSSMIVCHFLIRMSPFTHMFKTLQGGDWDLPDRLFSSVKRAYDSAAQDSRGDVRELIPEFYTCPEFLENSSRLDFGVLQNTGERIDDVNLPPWAKGDPLLFVNICRQALESDYVSEHLPAWIDLIWGYKQKDPESYNVYHPLSYEGAVDLDHISDELERDATVGIIHNFGQTPRKIFHQAHPPRLMHGVTTLPLGTPHGVEEDHHLILQAPRPLKNIDGAVCSIGIDVFAERAFPVKANALSVPGYINETVTWGHLDQSLRLVVDRKVVEVAEAAACFCAAFADSESLVTGSEDATVRIWRLSHRDKETSRDKDKDIGSALRLLFILRGHTEAVRCVAASRSWSIAVSGSDDGSISVWDLNRGTYVRSISYSSQPPSSKDGIRLVAIQESTGNIASLSGERLALHTINGRPIAVLQLPRAASLGLGDDIKSLAFHEREWSKLGVLATGGSGGITLRTWTFSGSPDGKDDRGEMANRFNWSFKTLRSLKCRTEDDRVAPTVTSLKFVGECLFSGDDRGRMYSWDLPE